MSAQSEGPWGYTFRRWLRKGHDHGSAAYEADKAEKRYAKECPNRRCKALGECANPGKCLAMTLAIAPK